MDLTGKSKKKFEDPKLPPVSREASEAQRKSILATIEAEKVIPQYQEPKWRP